MKLSFHGPVRSVTGSRHMLEVSGFELLLDCGLSQGRRDEAGSPEGKASSRAYPRMETCGRWDVCRFSACPLRAVHRSSNSTGIQPRGSPGSFGYVRAIQPGPSRVILVHGEEKQVLSLAVAIQPEYLKIEVTAPHVGSTIEM
jgi:predicted metal-dependent RNase